MIKKFLVIATCVVCSFLWSGAMGVGVVREFQGSSSTTTAEFLVKAPWLLDWRVNGEYSKVIGFEVDLLDVRSGLHAGRILKTKRVGNGVKLFDKGGLYKLRIDASLARWQIKIEEITKEEAARYTPRGS